MLCLKINDVKKFMSNLLVQTVFDNFLIAELDIVTFNAFHINGKINKTWFDTDELDTEEEYSKWHVVKPYAFQMIKGNKVPSTMKIVFYLSKENRDRMIQRVGGNWKEKDISQFCLNMKYEEGEMQLTTGVAYNIFTMDHTMQEQWDYDLKKFLKYYEIEFEEI